MGKDFRINASPIDFLAAFESFVQNERKVSTKRNQSGHPKRSTRSYAQEEAQPNISMVEESPAVMYVTKQDTPSSLSAGSFDPSRGGQSLHLSPIDSARRARKGTEYTEFKPIYDMLGFSNKKWAQILGVSEKTMQTITKEKRFLDQSKTERLLNFLFMFKYGLEVFGDALLFQKWLTYNSPALNGDVPLEFVDTIQGIDLLKDLLFKIESGNLA